MSANGGGGARDELLAAPLDRGRVRTRTDGRGGNLAYLETHDVIRTANRVFGFGKWGHEIVELRSLDPVTVHRDKKPGVSVGYVCVVRLTVEGCVPVGGVGFGDATEYRESGPVTAHELAAKEAESDALKRALKNYGDQFGLALYDKDAARGPHVTGGQNSAAAPVVKRGANMITRPQHAKIAILVKELDEAASPIPSEFAGAESWVDVLRQRLDAEYGVKSRTELTAKQASDLVDWLDAQSVPF